jgi:hypothetical protein
VLAAQSDPAGPPAALARLRLASRILTAVGIGLAIVVWVLYFPAKGNPADAATYYGIDMGDMYGDWRLGASDAYQYAPLFAQLTWPLRQLPFDAYVAVVRGLSLIAVAWLAGPFTAVVIFLPPVASEINAGNINLFLAVAVALGLRYPDESDPRRRPAVVRCATSMALARDRAGDDSARRGCLVRDRPGAVARVGESADHEPRPVDGVLPLLSGVVGATPPCGLHHPGGRDVGSLVARGDRDDDRRALAVLPYASDRDGRAPGAARGRLGGAGAAAGEASGASGGAKRDVGMT